MNPLPFFPPPARAFSQTGNHSPSLEYSNSFKRQNNNNNNNNPSTSQTANQSRPNSLRNLASLRLTASHQGAVQSSQSNTSIPYSASSASSSSSSRITSQRRPQSGSGLPRSSAPSTPPAGIFSTMAAMNNNAPQNTASSSSSSSASSSSDTSTKPRSPPSEQQQQQQQQRPQSRTSSGTSSSRHEPTANQQATSPLTAPSGRMGASLPKGLFFDYVRAEEVGYCHGLEARAYDAEDQASKERMRYRQKNAPHLFFGAFVPNAPPKVAGPLSVGHFSTPRKLIGFINGTASSNLSARSLAVHSVTNSEEGIEAWLVCLHSIVVDEAYRRKGVGLRMLEEFMTRLRRIEDGRGDSKRGSIEKPKGYECVALLCHQQSLRFFKKAGFQLQGISHVRCGSGGWIEMRRRVKGNHHSEGGGSMSSSSGYSESSTPTLPILDTKAGLQQGGWAFSASPITSNTGAPLAAFPTGTARHEVAAQKEAEAAMAAAAAAAAAAAGEENAIVSSSSSSSPPASTPSIHDDTPTAEEKKSLAAVDAIQSQSDGAPSPDQGESAPSGLGGFSQASLLAALAASSKGYAPGTNPSLPFSSVLGQTLAGKTFVEDAFVALEARLVDRRKGREDEEDSGASQDSNLAEIWCPREECGCKIIRKGVAIWELAESGPLSDPKLSLDSMPSHSSPLPPTPQPPPAPASHIRALKEREREHLKSMKKDGETYSTRSTLPGAPPSHQTSTPIRPFWSLLNPMSFENVAFSKDVKWTPPLPHERENSFSGGSGLEETLSANNNGNRTPPEDSGNASSGSGPSSGIREKPARKPSRRPTFFSSKKDKDRDRDRGDRDVAMLSGMPISHPHRVPEDSSGSPLMKTTSPPGGVELTIKYILCGNCETGPLGYVIIPPKLTDGKLGQAVEDKQRGINDLMIYLVAAERVRYRFVKERNWQEKLMKC
ncbi:unnamed protein product [Sympodiomycopsis kandeliae]